MAKKKIKDLVACELETFLFENGYELYNIEFVKEVKDWFLRVYIDRVSETEGKTLGIGTDDCEKVSRFLSARLDEIDPIEQNYFLEVSSPGMDRALLKDSDFIKYAGKPVEIHLYKSMDGKKIISGNLLGLEDKMIMLRDENGEILKIEFDKAAKTKLAVVF